MVVSFRYQKLNEETLSTLKANVGNVVSVYCLDFSRIAKYKSVTGPLVEAHDLWISVRHKEGHAPVIPFGDDGRGYFEDEQRGIVKIVTLKGEVLYQNDALLSVAQQYPLVEEHTNIPLKEARQTPKQQNGPFLGSIEDFAAWLRDPK